MCKGARSQKPRRQSRISKFEFRICLLGFWLLAPLHAETIDKIVAVVEGRIITLSDVRQEGSIRSILGEKPIDDEPLIHQLIERHLIENQLVGFPGINVEEEEIAAEIAKLQGKDDLPAEALHDAVLRRIRIAKYFDVRFRQFLRATDDDVRKYYDEVFIPEARARGTNPIPPLEQVADAVRKNVLEEQLDHEVTIWLEAVRRRSSIEILK
jgi:hypothetical protein